MWMFPFRFITKRFITHSVFIFDIKVHHCHTYSTRLTANNHMFIRLSLPVYIFVLSIHKFKKYW